MYINTVDIMNSEGLENRKWSWKGISGKRDESSSSQTEKPKTFHLIQLGRHT